jgi:hypothetical protein
VEVYIDVIERLDVYIALNGTIEKAEITGKVVHLGHLPALLFVSP